MTTSSISSLQLGLASGLVVNVSRVFLGDLALLNEATLLRASAERGFAGVSSGIGFLGSPQWAIGGALVLGLAEHLASTVTSKQAARDLQSAASLSTRSAELGEWVDISLIRNVHSPDLRKWWALSARDSSPLVHSGDPFLAVLSSDGHVFQVKIEAIEWLKVEPPVDPSVPPVELEVASRKAPTRLVSIDFSLPSLDSRSRLRVLNLIAGIQADPSSGAEKRIELLQALGAKVVRVEHETELVFNHHPGVIRFMSDADLVAWVDCDIIPLATA